MSTPFLPISMLIFDWWSLGIHPGHEGCLLVFKLHCGLVVLGESHGRAEGS